MNRPNSRPGMASSGRRSADDLQAQQLREQLFSKLDNQRRPLENYITHATIDEVSSLADLQRGTDHRKPRVAILAAQRDGKVLMHKAREHEGKYQIGRTWGLAELTCLENPGEHVKGIVIHFGKPYYWGLRSESAKERFVTGIINVYKKYTGRFPSLVNFQPPGGGTPVVQGGAAMRTPQTPGVAAPGAPGTPSTYGSRTPGSSQRSQSPQRDLRHMDLRRPPPLSPRRMSAASAVSQGSQASSQASGAQSQHPQHLPQPQPPQQPQHQSPQQPQHQQPQHQQSQQHHQAPQPQAQYGQATQPLQPQQQPLQQNTQPLQQPQVPVKADRTSASQSMRSVAPEPPTHTQPLAAPSVPPAAASSRHASVASIRSREGSGSPHIPPTSDLRSFKSVRHPSRGAEPDEAPSIPARSSRIASEGQPIDTRRTSEAHTDVAGAAGMAAAAATVAAQARRPSQVSIPQLDVRRPSETRQPPQPHPQPPQSQSEEAARSLPPAQPQTETKPDPVRAAQAQPAEVQGPAETQGPAQSPAQGLAPAAPIAAAVAGGAVAGGAVAAGRGRLQDPPLLRPSSAATQRKSLSPKRHSPERPQSPGQNSPMRSALGSETPRRSWFSRDIMSPRRGKHARNQSGASQHSLASLDVDEKQSFIDLQTVLNEFQWSGDETTKSLEGQINERLTQLGRDNVANVVSLDQRLDELDALMADSLDECQRMEQLTGYFIVQLSAIGDEVSHIEGQGQGLQVVTMNQKSLCSELENLLEMVHLPQQVTECVSAAGFTVDELPQLETALTELFGAVQLSGRDTSDGLGGMKIIKEQKDSINAYANDFSKRFAAFLKSQLRALDTDGTDAKGRMVRVDVPFMEYLYPFAGLVLFVKESNPAIYQSLLNAYVSDARGYYDRTLASFLAAWKRKLEQVLGKRPPFVFQDSQSHVVTTGVAKRTKTLRQAAHIGGTSSSSGHAKAATPTTSDLPPAAIAAVEKLLAELVAAVQTHVAAQQQVLVQFFHLSSYGCEGFDMYVHRQPVRVRCAQAAQFGGPPSWHEVDTSRALAQQVREVVGSIFGKLGPTLSSAGAFLASQAVLESVYLIASVETQILELQSTDQEFLVEVLRKFSASLQKNWTAYIGEQTRLILGSHVTKKRHGVLPVVAHFTTYISLVERLLSDLPGDMDKLEVRKLVDNGHEQLYRALLQIFQQPSQEIQAVGEDKDLLNHHVTLISNLNGIVMGMDRVSSFSVQKLVLQAKDTYRSELDSYVLDVLHRPLGRIMEYVDHSERENKPAKQKHQVAALKKTLTGFESREVRKGIDTLRKRVEKHFSSDEDDLDRALVDKVWKAIQEKYLDYYARLQRLAKKYDAEGLVEVSRNDIQSSFI